MSISFIFAFAPVPLTDEFSPLAHAAALARRRQTESENPVSSPRYRIRPASEKTAAEPAFN